MPKFATAAVRFDDADDQSEPQLVIDDILNAGHYGTLDQGTRDAMLLEPMALSFRDLVARTDALLAGSSLALCA